MLMDWLKRAPTAVVVTVIIMCGLVALGVLGTYAALTLNGQDTTEFRQWINTVGQILVFPFLGVTAVASVSAARSAGKTEEQTNGQLTAARAEAEQARAESERLRTLLRGEGRRG